MGMTIMKRILSAVFFSAILASAGSAPAQPLSELSCSELWFARNRIYAKAGYCFESDRAIAVFGRRCYPPYGRLSRHQQRRVNQIKRWEARKGCP
jgi:hypothetical protein